jgi:hypothetical protein
MILLCFETQVLCGLERLHALGRRCSVDLQCYATSSSAATATVVTTVMVAWLARWQANEPGLHYYVPEVPSEQETFLNRCCRKTVPCCCVVELGVTGCQLVPAC